MERLVNESEFTYVEEKVNWKQAIEIGVEMLTQKGFSTTVLFNQIIESTQKFGPYYILSEKIALAHASPGEWSLKPGLVLVYLENEVFVLDSPKHPVKCMFVLSAPDNESHMTLLQKFANALSDKDFRQSLIRDSNKKEVIELLFPKK